MLFARAATPDRQLHERELPRTARSRWAGLAPGQLLAHRASGRLPLVGLARARTSSSATHRSLAALSIGELGSRAGLCTLAAFGCAAWLVHACSGLLAFALARLTRVALSRPRDRRRELADRRLVRRARGPRVGRKHDLVSRVAVSPATNPAWRAALSRNAPDRMARWLASRWSSCLLVRALPAPAAALRHAGARSRSRRRACCRYGRFFVPPLPPRSRCRAPDVDARAACRHHRHRFAAQRPVGAAPTATADAPNIDAFLQRARRFSDATSPLAAHLPGLGLDPDRPPSRHDQCALQPDAAPARARGRHARPTRCERTAIARSTRPTKCASRTSTESFGFDQLITPPIGAVGFPAGLRRRHAAREPRRVDAGRRLALSRRITRTAPRIVTYRPRDFVRRLERELAVDGPTFLAIHLTLAHWPYAWAGTADAQRRRRTTAPPTARRSTEVDRQFARRAADCSRTRACSTTPSSSLLSDHGEALGADDDSMLRETGTSREIWDSLWGHGTSVMSPHQYQRAARDARLRPRAPARARSRTTTGRCRSKTCGRRSRNSRPARRPTTSTASRCCPISPIRRARRRSQRRIRFTETDFNTPKTLAGPVTRPRARRRGGRLLRARPRIGLGAVAAEPPARTDCAQAARRPLAGLAPGGDPGPDRRPGPALPVLRPPQPAATAPRRPHRTPRPTPRPRASGRPCRRAFRASCPPSRAALNVNPVKGLRAALWEHSGSFNNCWHGWVRLQDPGFPGASGAR